MKKFSTLLLCGALALGQAAAQQVGKVTNLTGEPGQVVAMRGNAAHILFEGAPVFLNDRVIAPAGSSVRIEAFGCNKPLRSGTMINVSEAMCKAKPASFTSATTTTTNSPALAAPGIVGGGMGTTAAIVGGAALTTPAIIGAASSESDGDDGLTPASP